MSHHKPYAELQFGEYLLTADKKKLDVQYLYNLLCIPSRYSTGLPPERFPLIIENSVCFCVFHQGKQWVFFRHKARYKRQSQAPIGCILVLKAFHSQNSSK